MNVKIAVMYSGWKEILMKNKKCVLCGREYDESNGYGVCLQCEEGVDEDNRECHKSSATHKGDQK